MRISDWSSDVCSSDRFDATDYRLPRAARFMGNVSLLYSHAVGADLIDASANYSYTTKVYQDIYHVIEQPSYGTLNARAGYLFVRDGLRSEEHTSELQSLMRISYAVFCLKKKKNLTHIISYYILRIF